MAGNRDADPSTSELPAAADLSAIDPEAREVVESCLELARERLDMPIAWLGEFHMGREIFRIVDGDLEGWGLWDDFWLPAAETYCERMLDGRIGNAIPDTSLDPEVCDLEVTQQLRIGSYVGVPLVLRSGELRGAFCCARHTPTLTLGERDVRFMQVLARVVADELGYRETAARLRRLEAQAAGAEALAAALEARDGYTGEHSHAVVELAGRLAADLGLSEAEIASVKQVALLHDIGKVGIPDAILRKTSALNDDERAVMRTHPAIGAALIERIGALAHLAPAIRAEHEQWDGGGYPEGLAREEIPVESRITLVCDGYHAMVSDRPYRRAMPEPAALAELRRCSGSMFWPAAADALIDWLETQRGTGRSGAAEGA